jgi:phosphinothricin acetyltransferase
VLSVRDGSDADVEAITAIHNALLATTTLAVRARAAGKRQMIGAFDGSNVGSLAFHARLGFTTVGCLPAIGFKLGTWLDLVVVQRSLVDR